MNSHGPTVDYKELMLLGFPEHTARDIIRHAKKLAVLEFEEARKKRSSMVQLRQSPFDNQRIGIAPTEIVEAIVGFPLDRKQEIK